MNISSRQSISFMCDKMNLQESDPVLKKVKFLSFTQLTSKYHLLWPKRVNKKYVCAFCCLLIALNICTLGFWGHMIKTVLDDKQFQYTKVATDIACLMAIYTIMYVFYTFVNIKDNLHDILEALGDFTSFEMPRRIMKTNKYLDLETKVIISALYGSGAFLWIYNILEECHPKDQSSCGFVLDVYLPFDIFSSPNRQIYMTIQLVSIFMLGMMGLLISSIVVNTMSLLVEYVQHLQEMLLLIPLMEGRENRKKQIKQCVQYHYRIIELLENLSKHASAPLIVHVFNTPLIISMILFEFVKGEFEFIDAVHLGAWGFSSTIANLKAQKLIDISDELSLTVYNSIPWDGDNETARDLQLIMTRTSKNLHLWGGKFAILGRGQLMHMMKTSYSYLAFISNTN